MPSHHHYRLFMISVFIYICSQFRWEMLEIIHMHAYIPSANIPLCFFLVANQEIRTI
ncbi:hypothetical protein BGX38DRAFT_1176523 [Terfezia claveryi]|nr:hypothetical protein BGX38DRAFT_1176523 [Terfezia claveryi]